MNFTTLTPMCQYVLEWIALGRLGQPCSSREAQYQLFFDPHDRFVWVHSMRTLWLAPKGVNGHPMVRCTSHKRNDGRAGIGSTPPRLTHRSPAYELTRQDSERPVYEWADGWRPCLEVPWSLEWTWGIYMNAALSNAKAWHARNLRFPGLVFTVDQSREQIALIEECINGR